MTKRALKRQLREGALDLSEFEGDPRIRRLPVERAWSPLPRRAEDERDQAFVKTVRPMSEGQKAMMTAIDAHNLVLALGPAGTGKTYLAIAKSVEAHESGKVGRIVLSRPAVEAGEQLGFLPGDLDEKFSPYIDAFRDILNARLGAGTVDYCLRHGRIQASPLAYMRGKTFDERSFVVLDEAQNTTPAQMKLFLTRIGEGAKVVVNGDVRQSDIRGPNGLEDAIHRLRGLPGVVVHAFEREDIVRSGLVRDIIDRYEPDDEGSF